MPLFSLPPALAWPYERRCKQVRTDHHQQQSKNPLQSRWVARAPRISCLNARTSSLSRFDRVRPFPHEHSKSIRCSERQSSSKPRSISCSPQPHSRMMRAEQGTVLSDSECCCTRSPHSGPSAQPLRLELAPRRRGSATGTSILQDPAPRRLPPPKAPKGARSNPPLLFDNTAEYGKQDELFLRSATL
jgi:hypothetical protein